MTENSNKNLFIQIAFLLSLIATAGSLFFSEVMKLPPCVLCWYQRIFMYPLVLIFGLSLFFKLKEASIYGIALSVFGLIISIYHNLLYYKIIPDSIKPCSQGVSCTSKQIEWFGFVTIPFLSMVSFMGLTYVCYRILKYERSYEKQ